MEILSRGAEAIIYIDKNKIIKKRIFKKYVEESIMNNLLKTRTKQEVIIMKKLLSLGIKVPKILDVDYNNYSIEIEYLKEGKVLKNTNINERTIKEMASIVSTLHNNNIIHGDLTLRNFILYNKEVYIIDFGLSFYSTRYEDKAMDVFVLYESSKADSFDFDLFFNYYLSYVDKKEEIKNRFERIVKRRKYM